MKVHSSWDFAPVVRQVGCLQGFGFFQVHMVSIRSGVAAVFISLGKDPAANDCGLIIYCLNKVTFWFISAFKKGVETALSFHTDIFKYMIVRYGTVEIFCFGFIVDAI